ncbi:heavy metal translocating P-type ATPase [Niabella drilacis]|uniref:P-type Zn(2+) transporter n=1 Tax=Niabella drilacis (strain DSM 25811 / CCM 8410 / CCUG 62505 / LMG 26954 / E90) TaxID=1285928 RepID=A0A1G6IL00_NIADE|nr:heavy metal translocating P-type ATPase [Niabella drilacis]SDC07144.1 Cd2+/Zn2+-exporting ATPase [Niabella drilacis]
MEKTRINLEIVLPGIPDERDECVARLIGLLQYRRGIDKVHVISGEADQKAQLCFHYDPSEILLDEVEQIAGRAGAAITAHYGHLLIEVRGVRHLRHARMIEATLRKHKGLLNASVSGTGFIRVEYNKGETTGKAILERVEKTGLAVSGVEDFHARGQKPREEAHEDHEHDHEAGAHEHAHGGIFGERTELIFAIICGLLLGLGFGLSFVNGLPPAISIWFYIAAYFFGGFFTTKEAVEGIRKGTFEIDFLMLVAAVGAAVLGQWAEGALLLFLFSLGHSLEHYAMERAKRSIAGLAALAPKTALLKAGGAIEEVQIEALKQGDIIVVKPNSKIAADGIVVKGSSSVNQAPITGESVPVDKMAVDDVDMDLQSSGKLDARYKVFAGSINGGANLEVKVTKVAADSTIARLVKLVNEAQTQKSPTQNFTDKLERYYVPSVLILVGILLLAFLVVDEPFSASFYRAMAVLVAASPCALAISTPSAVLSGVARAARGGVLIKGGKPLEELGALSAIAFDKTGTLTEGKPRLTGVYPLNGISEEQLLEIVIAVEKLSDHPLAAAIVKDGTERLKRAVAAAENVSAIQGRGIKAQYNGTTVHVGNKELFAGKNTGLPDDLKAKVEELERQGNTTMLVQQNDLYAGIITLMDVAREDAKETLTQLTGIGIRKMIMLTGDNQKVAEAIAGEIGITDAWGNLLPEQKVAAIEKLRASETRVAMVGDGVNDAPAMAKSTVGIAMGAAGSDVALETADIALMADQLSNLPFAIGLSRKAGRIIRQNLVLSLGMVAVLIPLTILGIADIGPAVIGHEGSTLVVVFNALRLLGYKK